MKRLILDALQELKSADFRRFTWELENGVAEGVARIPASKLEKADHQDVVDLMTQYYTTNAGSIAVLALRNINQNNLAAELEPRLQEVSLASAHPRDQVDGRNAPVPEEEPLLIKSDWIRPSGIKPCSQETKDRLLRENRDDIYIPKEKSQRTRLALLITNIHFADNRNNRAGAEKDEENMEWLLTALGYTVVKHRNLSGEGIENAVKTFAARPEHRDSDSTFVVIMSHGNTIHNKDAILGVNYDEENNHADVFFVDDIFFHLNSVNCPALIDKPKVILIQACRGGDGGGVEIKSDAIIHTEKDSVSFKATLPGVRAYRTGANGSFFICYIVQVFSKCAHADEIRELFRKVALCMENDPLFECVKVDGRLAKIMPCVDRMSLSKKFFLFPGL
ncbi:caspase b-like [Pseudorasbora parva]|uniref:caspase b-like n=1 Tax=Pseudorasbora parva TaxID=51549 RepID=UPI00351E6DF3